MRFEFDDNGYVSCILYGCSTGSCVEYTGLVPSEPEEYADMDDWADRAQVQAYYLNALGNLTYDAFRAASLPNEDDIAPYSSDQIRKMGIVDVIYPVGSIYMSVNNVNPEFLFGGRWVQIEDTFLLSAGSTFTAGETGGAESYELSASHKHIAPVGATSSALGLVSVNGTVSGGSGKAYQGSSIEYSGNMPANATLGYTTDATVNATIPTLPPYLVVYIWKRIDDPESETYSELVDNAGNTVLDANKNEIVVMR